MKQISRPFLVMLFALLQCLAPLLHAHAGLPSDGGVHLPERQVRVAGTAGDTVAGLLVQAGDVQPEVAIGIAGALEARDDGRFAAAPGHVYRLPIAASARVAAWGSVLASSRHHPASRHFLPQPCAPPGA